MQFNQAIDRVWGESLEKANRRGVAIPEKLGPEDFGIRTGDGQAEYARYYDELAIVGAALGALIEAGLTEIRRPAVLEEEDLEISGSDSFLCRFRGCSFDVAGPYDSFVRTFTNLQEAGNFLQVRMIELRPRREDASVLQGTLEFVGIRLVDGSTLEDSGPSEGLAPPASRRSKR